MTIESEIQSLSPSALIELFEIDMTNFPGGDTVRVHAGKNEFRQNVVWGGITYTALPIEATGFDVSSKGTQPRPSIRLANIDGSFSSLLAGYDDLVGCKITRKRTFARYLDAVNFVAGNPTADPNQHFQDDVWFVERKVSENRHIVEWELSSAFDLQGVMLPFRQIIQNSCSWGYRSAECGYAQSNYFDVLDLSTTQPNDKCGKNLSSCKVRFGDSAILPFGGFPGAVRFG